MIHFVLCGHGTYGSSLKESLSMLVGEVEGVSVIDFTREMGSSELTEQIKLKLDELGDTPTLFITDLFGGAPFKTCSIESLNYENKIVLAGTNLTGLLEIYFQRQEDLENLAQKAVDASKESIAYFPKSE